MADVGLVLSLTPYGGPGGQTACMRPVPAGTAKLLEQLHSVSAACGCCSAWAQAVHPHAVDGKNCGGME